MWCSVDEYHSGSEIGIFNIGGDLLFYIVI